MKESIDYIDVDKLSDLPEISSGRKYLEFLGGLRRYRCFIVNKNCSRCDFYNEHLYLIDKSLHPVYKNRQAYPSLLSEFYLESIDRQLLFSYHFFRLPTIRHDNLFEPVANQS